MNDSQRNTQQVWDEVSIARARAGLNELAIEGSRRLPQRLLLLSSLAPELQMLWRKGLTADEISESLALANLALPADTIRAYFAEMQVGRIAALERRLSQHRTLGTQDAGDRLLETAECLRRAIHTDEGLTLHYQPRFCVSKGTVQSVEALLRWHYKNMLLPPTAFVPIAEQSQLIDELGEWVLRQACREAKRWQNARLGGTQGITVAVNLSVKQLSSRLPDIVHSVLCDTGLPTQLLELEITESALADDHAPAILHKLSEAGIHLSLDDFGTGYSCLAQLKDLPINTIKIDQSFVGALNRNDVSNALVEGIISLAHKLGMATLAEGVETQKQAQLLQAMGCTTYQGFLYAAPMPAIALVDFIHCTNVQRELMTENGPKLSTHSVDIAHAIQHTTREASRDLRHA